MGMWKDNGHVDFKWLINLSSVSGTELVCYLWQENSGSAFCDWIV